MLEDHPRMRGEKYRLLQIRLLYTGSPPHARGKVEDIFVDIVNGRITPACAGKSLVQRFKLGTPEDHPRMRGEKSETVVGYLVL